MQTDANLPAAACVCIPMDGFHYTREELKSIGNSPDSNYSYEDLLARRGSPWTFDAEGCIKKFTEARVNGKASLPVYCRVKSDPVEDGATLNSETKIVLLEGNYLLSWRDSRWQPLQTNNVFDETWYISCTSLDDQRARLVQRHLETWSTEKTKMWGSGEQGAGAKADENDMLNLVWIEEMSKGYADLIIEST
jgi:pantothenate kinase